MILRYFGERPPERCGNCDRCLGLAGDAGPSYPDDLYAAIIELRATLAQRSGREPHDVFEARTAEDLATHRPRSEQELEETWGIAAVRARWFGAELLRLIAQWEEAHPEAPQRAVRTAVAPARSRGAAESGASAAVSADDPLYRLLREWRLERARADGVPAYTLFSDRTLREIVAQRPRDGAALRAVWGLGDAKVQRFGSDVLAVIRESGATDA